MTRWSLVVLLLAFSLFLNVTKVYEPDTFWHIRTGQLIVAEHRVPRTDIYSLDGEEKPWTDHSWLAEVVFSLVYRAGGFPGLTFLKAALVTLAFLLIFWAALRCGSNPYYAAFLVVCFLLAARFRFTERPHIFTIFFLALFAWTLSREKGRSETASGGPRLLILFPLLSLAWANLHAGVIFGIVLLGLHVVSRAASAAWSGRLRRRKHRMEFAAFLATVILSLIATLLTPNTTGLYSFFSSQSRVREYAQIAEFLPLVSEAALPHALFASAMILSVLLTLRKRRAEDIAVALIFGALALAYRRALPDFFAASGAGLIAASQDLLSPLYARIGRRMRSGLELVPVGLVLLGGYWVHHTDYLRLQGIGVLDLYFPQKAIQFISDGNFHGRIFNSTNFGGAMILLGFPRIKPYLDTRNELHEGAVRELAAAMAGPGHFASFLDAHRFDLALVEPYQGYIKNGFFPGKDWALLYWDDSAMVLARRTAENAGAIRTGEYRFVNPEDTYEKIARIASDAALRVPAEKELRRCLELNPGTSRALVLLGMLYSSESRWDEAEHEFLRALEVHPSSFTANYEAARFYRIKGDHGESLRYFTKALSLARIYGITGAALARLDMEAARARKATRGGQ